MKSDIEIARAKKLAPITEIGAKLDIPPESLIPYGWEMAKLDPAFIAGLDGRPDGRLILVTATSPTPAGEGKTTVSVGLGDALNRIGKRAAICLREPSLGPCFGMKGGAAGGGHAQVVPMERINLHFTGDFHAITAAHNLLAAMIDNHVHWGNELTLDRRRITWRRAMDMNDRALRSIINSLGGAANGYPREDGFDITVASEVMAVFCLALDLRDLEQRLGRMIIGYRRDKTPVRAADLKAQGAMTVLLKDALAPNLVQTLEGNPAFVHGGPFANIAHGCNSVVATRTALKLADYVVTEAGFGADLGAEKFFDIKCRSAGLDTAAVVLVATVRALKMHGGGPKVTAGTPLAAEYTNENLDLVRAGADNLLAHCRIAAKFGIPVVVAINRFPTDTDAELELVRQIAVQEDGVVDAVVCDHYSKGGAGAVELGKAVMQAATLPSKFAFLYPLEASIKDKIETIAREVYGADGVDYSEQAEARVEQYTRLGYDKLPICMAKTHLSLSHDPALKGVPKGFRIPIRDISASIGAGFLYPLLGTLSTMPGLPTRPAYYDIDIDFETGKILGLS